MVLLLDKLVLGVDLYLSIEFSVSSLFFLKVYNFSLNVCDLYVLSIVSIFFFDDIGDVLASSKTVFLISLICQLCRY